MDKLTKVEAGYQHQPNTEYGCCDCIIYLDRMRKCAVIYDQESVLSFDGCDYFLKGSPGVLGQQFTILNRNQAGFVRSNFGFSCKRCEHFGVANWNCEKVNKDSPGDDLGIIHPDACCNEHELDPIRGNMPTDKVREFISENREEQTTYVER